MRHNALLCTLLAVLVLGCATMILASPAPTSLPTPTCGLAFDAPGEEGEPLVSKMELPGSGPVEPEFLARGFKRYCRCSCSSVPNCSTSADCGGSPCLAGVTCC